MKRFTAYFHCLCPFVALAALAFSGCATGPGVLGGDGLPGAPRTAATTASPPSQAYQPVTYPIPSADRYERKLVTTPSRNSLGRSAPCATG